MQTNYSEPVLESSRVGGLTPLPLVPLNPQVCIDSEKIVNISNKYIADPPSGFPTNRVLLRTIMKANAHSLILITTCYICYIAKYSY